MTKSELRKARKNAIQSGNKLIGDLAIKQNAKPSNRTVNRKASRKRASERKKSI